MPFTFLDLPRTSWVASNALAFAIRDAYPVSPGHTLVIPKRLVRDWFEATRDEQHAIVDLVDLVKKQLEGELHPQGFNIGFNVGAAAGQTVFHLHVHVIPRFAGDVPDPRGGDSGEGELPRRRGAQSFEWVASALVGHGLLRLQPSRHHTGQCRRLPSASALRRWFST